MIEIDGEDEVDNGDLNDGCSQRLHDGAGAVLLVFAFDVVVDLARALDQKEQAAGEEDKIAPGEGISRRR